ncbi:MAG: winged helix DNA-binding domain-containing protein [Vallitalea sp.]|jgi:uncharacterized protein YcaQ|nr:winged helix DNA-binding domain-containing protein [Vallitalea sp.]
MNKTIITKKQARRFILLKQGLYGEKKFIDKNGIYEFVKQAGCIQFDPIDVCGKNHELVLQSRISGFKVRFLYELLYKDRLLMDWFDKNMSICLVEDWPYFSHERELAKKSSRSKADVDKVAESVLDYIKEKGPVCSADLEYNNKVDWSWAPTSLSRAVLDTLYYRGNLVISHKKNTRKYYDLASRYINKKLLNDLNPNRTNEEIYQWHILRRIGSVGMLHNNASYAFIGIDGMKSKERNNAFETLLSCGLIKEIIVDGIKKPFYYKTVDNHILQKVINDEKKSERIEFIAPLDNVLWDRKLIEEIFGFSYKWEIYTPIKNRKYGYYVLPILKDDTFIGRIELVRNKIQKCFDIVNIWWENPKYDTEENYKKTQIHLKHFSDMMF